MNRLEKIGLLSILKTKQECADAEAEKNKKAAEGIQEMCDAKLARIDDYQRHRGISHGLGLAIGEIERIRTAD